MEHLILVSAVTPVMNYAESIEEVSDILLSERLKRLEQRREFRFKIRLARAKGYFPLFRNGRMVVCHPDYNKS